MKALSIRQPWAYAILHLGKDIENRTRNTKHRGTILIHASKTIDKEAIEEFKKAGYELPDKFETGGIVGSVQIVDCVEQHNSKWFTGPKGFVLANPTKLDFFKLNGQLGFFRVEQWPQITSKLRTKKQ